jgi:trk system potassium uptake protein
MTRAIDPPGVKGLNQAQCPTGQGRMKVIICGAGQVGWQIARHLAGEKNDVTVVDNNPDLVRRATDTLDVQGDRGFASYPDVLERAGARDADMIIAATHSDEVNMVTCQVAHSVFGAAQDRAAARAEAIWMRSMPTFTAAIICPSTW